MRCVGILGGMGPEATILLMQRVLAAVPARDDADHVPLIVDQNPQVPSRIAWLIEGTGVDPAPVLADMARRLQSAGAEALAISCNTAHHYAETVATATNLPLLDMVALSVRRAAQVAGRGATIGVLASPAVRRIALFEAPMHAAELTPLYAQLDDEPALLAAIRRIKTQTDLTDARAALRDASEALLAKGATVQLVACSEFSLIVDTMPEGVHVIDTLDVLVAAIVEFARGSVCDSE